MVGIGGDGSGTAAARTAARVASLMNAKLVLVFGFEPSSLGPRGGPLEEEIRAVGERAIAEVRAELVSSYPDLTIESEFVQDKAVEALIAYELVHRAPRPVLVVPDDPADA